MQIYTLIALIKPVIGNHLFNQLNAFEGDMFPEVNDHGRNMLHKSS